MWNKILICIGFLFLLSCATPRVWVISQYDGGGAIGYQNYNPRSDDGQLISNLLQCVDHKMTWNGIKQGYATPTVYQAYNNGYGSATVVPLDGGSYEWGEYHYQCNEKNSDKLTRSNSEVEHKSALSEYDYCIKKCIKKIEEGQLGHVKSVEECASKFCD